ncbi:hypothetical protein R3P38DRAFT_2593656 [Favolaschia claudopus]|uniref:RNA polymerase II-associated protein 3 n=1 Tax=Favolaschia claudopus TaxID=2862362 RepID=A0AAW0EI22_9AGAR
MAQAAQEKEKGNAAFKTGDYPAAIGHYSAAIHADRTDATFPLNRAAAYLKLGKNEDAERDCSTVLTLSKNNVKALFRRAQARVGMGKLSEAQQDLKDAAKLEPANESVKQELSKVAELFRQASAKQKSKPVAADVASTSTPKRRRIPITIVEPDGRRITPTTPADGSSENAKPATTTTTTVPPPKSTDLMKPVSSRPLTPSSSSTNGSTPPPKPKPESTSPPTPASSSFKDAKTTRDSSKPSRIGGGIFRASGENTIFSPRETRPPPPPPTQPESETPPPVKQEAPAPPLPSIPPPQTSPITPSSVKTKPPMTLFDFTHTWAREPTPGARSALLSQIPPPTLPSLFQTSLDPSLFVEIVDTLALSTGGMDVASTDVVDGKAYMHAFANVPRFGTVLRFLSRAEKARVRELWSSLLGEGGEGQGRPVQLDKIWDAVYP